MNSKNIPNISIESLFYFLSALGTLMIFSISLYIPKGYNYGAIILTIPALLAIPFWWKNRVISPHFYNLAFIILFVSLTGFLDAWLSQSTGSLYETPSKYFLSIFLLIFLITYPPKPKHIWWGVAIGSIGAGLSSIYYTITDPTIIRASKYLNPVLFGDFSALFTIICFCGIFPTKGQSKTLLLFLVSGMILGFTATVLSQTRGAWLAFFITISILILVNFNRIDKSKLIKVIIPTLLILLGTILFLGKSRINYAISEIKTYQTNKSSSVGARLEMWKFGLTKGIQNPILGTTTKQLKKESIDWLKKYGKDTKILIETPHLHNEYIDIFARRGIIGLVSLLLLLFYPLFIYIKDNKKINTQLNPKKLRLNNVAITHLISFISFGLVDGFIMIFNNAFIMFMILFCIIYASYYQEKIKKQP